MGTPEAQEIEGRASEFETLSGDELLKLEARSAHKRGYRLRPPAALEDANADCHAIAPQDMFKLPLKTCGGPSKEARFLANA